MDQILNSFIRCQASLIVYWLCLYKAKPKFWVWSDLQSYTRTPQNALICPYCPYLLRLLSQFEMEWNLKVIISPVQAQSYNDSINLAD